MTQSVEAILDPSGAVRLLEPLAVSKPTRVILTVLPESSIADEYRQELPTLDSAELRARREDAVRRYRAGEGLTTTEAIAHFRRRIAEAGLT